jgi:peroxiredoxin
MDTMTAPPVTLLGQRLPIVPVFTPDGATTTLQSWLGPQSSLVYCLHGVWCADCATQLFSLQRRSRAIMATGATMVAVTQDGPASLSAFMVSAAFPFAFTLLADPDRNAAGALGDLTALVVDGGGLVRWHTVGDLHRHPPGLNGVLQALLATTAPAVLVGVR